MTRVEAQALAEELVLRMARASLKLGDVDPSVS